MILGNIITIPFLIGSFFIGLGHFIMRCFMNNIILSIIFFMMIFVMGIFIGAGHTLEYAVKLLFSPLAGSSGEIVKSIASQHRLLRLVFCVLSLSSANFYLIPETFYAMTAFYVCFEAYSFWSS
jgi:hypothetical protein